MTEGGIRFDDATRAQVAAADPAGSVWLTANAGSGKTRVLTDRVAWLLLEGTPPERILCLTFTKAAAGEMQNRLFQRLGDWTMRSDDDLRAALLRLGVPRGRIDSERLKRARTLFARAIETPGGLKIQTIHAFCAGLLRRFPLEAGVSPAFTEMDDQTAARLHADVLDAMAADPATRPLVDGIAAHLSSDVAPFLAQVAAHWPPGLPGLDEDGLRIALGLQGETPEAIADETVTGDDIDLIERVRDAAAGETGATTLRLHDLLSQAYLAEPMARLDLLSEALLTREGTPRKRLVVKSVGEKIGPDAVEDLAALAQRLAEARARLAALRGLAPSRALHEFAPHFADRVAAAKRARGWLDFDDQIRLARDLLSTRAMAQWVLFKLDGGVDHILVDEAQDTSPRQWDVIAALAAEFGAGQGARPDVPRTLFVVGDRKQSIYSFQGADAAAFDRMRELFRDRLTDPPLTDHALRHSFRSAPAILELVDAVFCEGGGVGAAPTHLAHRVDQPGRVDLWPPVPEPEAPTEDRVWHDPIDRPAPEDPTRVLARTIAAEIRRMIEARVPITRKGERHAVTEGDILILFQRRRELFYAVIEACRAEGLNLAGADRLKLMDDLAARDLVALLRWLDVPEDDLSLAAVLRSPLGGLDEDALYRLAQGRGEATLWSRLRDKGETPQVAMLRDLLAQADRLRPHELLQRILIRHDGRRRLLARIGMESADAIDALLAQALTFETAQVPTLTGFLGWLDAAEIVVKRQPGAGAIRVMSVHGAKGLEAPVVILPETMMRKVEAPAGVAVLPDGPPIWMPRSAEHTPVTAALSEAAKAAIAAERERLLYVALTRAESWLIAGAAGKVADDGDGDPSWWCRIEAGLKACGAVPYASPLGPEAGAGLRLERGDWTTPAPGDADAPGAGFESDPVLETPAPPPDRPAGRLTPSDLPGPKTLPGEAAGTPDALARGTAIHALLEHLPRLAPDDRPAAAEAILRDIEDAETALAEARAALEHPELQWLFAPDALTEAPFALPAKPGRPAVFGTMDRVLVAPDRVTIVDYKTNAAIPATPSEVPAGLLRQMAAYLLAGEAIWPGRRIAPAILWTREARLMELPADLLRAAWDGMGPIDPGAGGA